jgi:hypothetical protein
MTTTPVSENAMPPVPGTLGAFPQLTISAWREGTLTRATELKSLCQWALRNGAVGGSDALIAALDEHLHAAESAAEERFRLTGNGATIQRAAGNLDAAEADLLNFAPESYVLDQMPNLLNHVQRHLAADDSRRSGLERIAQAVGVKDADHALAPGHSVFDPLGNRTWSRSKEVIRRQRGRIVAAVRAASSEALRERLRVGSLRNAVMMASVVLTLLATGVAVLGFFYPSVIPMCFEPESNGSTVVVCPTSRSEVLDAKGAPVTGTPAPEQIDTTIQATAKPRDLFVVETIGFTAASIAAAAAIRSMRATSEPYGLSIALALLKMPTGCITAFLGLLLMRGGFVPGLSALDTPAQILAWAIVFGYAQQLFTRYVDQQASAVLGSVRGGDEGRASKRRK